MNAEEEFKNYLQSLTLNVQTLIKLDLHEKEIGNEGMQALSEALKGMKALSESLTVNQTLTNLDLQSNEIGSKGVEYLSHALKVKPNPY
ncbi:hypothetical protein M0812_08957 [Anaeramoeba flamelloides]|uniref:Uncharacterized protein n=1 Tax=Anaeramoeba flamelloides TaxID=1746091 RepID=A0AAV7ZQM2_9EUKA|nr:hypothetical protein M0812_08957 [Anaeramoeba flamelloides]